MRFNKPEMQRIFYGDDLIDIDNRVTTVMRTVFAFFGFALAALLIPLTLWLWMGKT